MNPIELLSFPSTADPDVLCAVLRDHKLELHFNGRLVWGDILRVVATGREEIATRMVVPDEEVEPCRLDIVLYHPEEKALYVAVDYALPWRHPSGEPFTDRMGKMIVQGPGPGTAELLDVSVGTSAKVLEFLDTLDLTRVLWLPLRP